MTPNLAALTYRVHLAAAADYAPILAETDPDTLARWAGDYHVSDVQEWARERVSNLLDECAGLWPLFCHDPDVVAGVQESARGWCEVLGLGELPC